MSFSEANSGSSHNWSSSVPEIISFFQVIEDVKHSWLGISPRPSILGLFLRPDYLSGAVVLLELFDDFLEREGTETFDSEDSSVLLTQFCSLGFQVVVHLSRAENDLLDLACVEVAFIADERQESSIVTEFVQTRSSTLELE